MEKKNLIQLNTNNIRFLDDLFCLHLLASPDANCGDRHVEKVAINGE